MSAQLPIPVRSMEALPGVFEVPARGCLASVRSADRLPLAQLASDLAPRLGTAPGIVWNAAGPAAVRVRRDPSLQGSEAYLLAITGDGIRIEAATDAGAYYGIQTLRDLVRSHGAILPCCRIADSPDFPRRGVYYDCARGKVPTVETMKALVERLAHWKLNEFQIYIKNTFTWHAHPEIGRGYSPYTPEDLLDIQEHCKRHHIRFVPSLATLSHSELTLQLPKYRHLAELPGAHGWEGGTTLCPTHPESFQLVESLYEEFAPLFEAEDFNVCMDEPWELGKGKSATPAHAHGVARLYLDFVLKVHGLCQRLGKRMNMWGDVVLARPELVPEIPPDVVMLNWDYSKHGRRIPRSAEFAAAELDFLACPGTSGWQRHGTDLPNATENVAQFSAAARTFGAQGMLNTDWGDFGHRNLLGASLHGFAHGAAHAWNGSAVDDATFTDTFARHTFPGTPGLAGAIRSLGAAAAAAGRHSVVLYHALVEPIHPPTDRFMSTFDPVSIVTHYPSQTNSAVERADPRGVRDVIDSLTRPRLWPEPPSTLPPFEQLALQELRLAARMDVLSARRILLAKAVRAGHCVPASALRTWADEAAALRTDFQRLWRARNRESRLPDNLRLLDLAIAEAATLATG